MGKIKYLIIALLMSGCISTKYKVDFPEQPILMPLPSSDMRNYVLMEDFPVLIDNNLVIIPKGFNTDLATVPQLFEAIITNNDPRILRPSILHDWEYCNHGNIFDGNIILSRDDCDHSLADGMKTEGASRWLRSGVYRAVKYGGEKYWNSYK